METGTAFRERSPALAKTNGGVLSQWEIYGQGNQYLPARKPRSYTNADTLCNYRQRRQLETKSGPAIGPGQTTQPGAEPHGSSSQQKKII